MRGQGGVIPFGHARVFGDFDLLADGDKPGTAVESQRLGLSSVQVWT